MSTLSISAHLLISFSKPTKKTFPGASSIKNSHLRSASRSMVHILGRCYPLGVKIHYLFAVLGATGSATVRKSKWHYVPIGSSGVRINLHDC
jgi:hypothetical protein